MRIRSLFRVVSGPGIVVLAVLVGACGQERAGSEERGAAPAEAPAGGSVAAAALPDSVEVLVYKTPTCGCCADWVTHLEDNGFTVITRDEPDLTAIKQTAGVPRDLQSCHTGIVGGYVIEGHVPADLVRRLLAERPDAAGLAVPGMPMGSPGMEGPRKDPYDVILFDREGGREVYARR